MQANHTHVIDQEIFDHSPLLLQLRITWSDSSRRPRVALLTHEWKWIVIPPISVAAIPVGATLSIICILLVMRRYFLRARISCDFPVPPQPGMHMISWPLLRPTHGQTYRYYYFRCKDCVEDQVTCVALAITIEMTCYDHKCSPLLPVQCKFISNTFLRGKVGGNWHNRRNGMITFKIVMIIVIIV